MTVIEIVADVTRRLETAGIPYAIGGSLASSVWGQMRLTNDADIVVLLPGSDPSILIEAFPEQYDLNESEIATALVSLDEFRVVQLLHKDEAFKIDLFLLRDGPYEATELARARRVALLDDTSAFFYAPENIVLAKLRWYRLGNRVSDRQWNDIVQVLEVQAGNLDNSYLDEWAEKLGVLPLLDEARSQTRP
ncbi:MAG: hypothetical protein P4L46_02575 [Fimbriimonas sp.]|nr:hypothetical protein [Fimbriimonas sp.]